MKVNIKNKVALKIFIHKNLVWVAVSLSILIFIVGYAFVIQPKLSKGNDDPNQSLEYIEEQLDLWENKLVKIQDLIGQFKAIPPSHLRRVKEFLPTEYEAPLLYIHLDALAKANNSALMQVSVSDAGAEISEETLTNSQGVRLGVVEVNAQFLLQPGNNGYQFYKGFLKSVENSLRLFDIESIIYTPNMETVNLSGKMYYLKDNE